MSWTLCTSGLAIADAGHNVNSTIIASGLTLGQWSDEAESFICSQVRSDVVANYDTLTSSGKYVFQELSASLIAQKIIMYQPDAILKSSSITRLNILENNITRIMKMLVDDKYKTYLGVT